MKRIPIKRRSEGWIVRRIDAIEAELTKLHAEMERREEAEFNSMCSYCIKDAKEYDCNWDYDRCTCPDKDD